MSDADVLTALRSLQPAGAPNWTPASAPADGDPLQRAFEEHADALYRYVSALTGRDAWLAEELVTRVFVGAAEGDDADRAPEALFMQARHAALAILAKAGETAAGPVAPAELALVLERRAGLPVEALARTWGARPAALEARLIDAAQHHTTGDEACTDWKEATVRASVDLLTEDQGEAWAEHLMQCEPCATWSESLEARLALDDGLPSKERTWERVQAELSKHARDLGIRVGVRCTYCHAGLPQAEASFCAACLAPHHTDCFEEHGTCAAPACGGTQLVYPQRPKVPTRRGARWPWILGAGLIGAAAFSPVAFEGGMAASNAEDKLAIVSAQRELPLGRLAPGCSRQTVIVTLGNPSGEIKDGSQTVFTYPRLGAQVRLDEADRLILASFYGERSATGRSEGVRWTFRGAPLGAPVPASILASSLAAPMRDQHGDFWLAHGEGVLLRLGEEPRTLLEVHVADGAQPDANGNLLPQPFVFEDAVVEVPLDVLQPGAWYEDVCQALGIPEDELIEEDGSSRASWYSKGARVGFDRKRRLVEAAFFGYPASDEHLDANGNRRIGGPVGTYQPAPWTFEGVGFGEPISPSLLSGAVSPSVPDADGTQFLEVRRGVFLELRGDRLQLAALYVASGMQPDANGNVAPGRFDLTVGHDAALSGKLPEEATASEAPQPSTAVHGPPRHLGGWSRPTGIFVRWSSNPNNAYVLVSFEVWRRDAEGSEWTRLGVLEQGAESFVDVSVTEPDHPYVYKVVSVAELDSQNPVVAINRVLLEDEAVRRESAELGPLSLTREDWGRAHPRIEQGRAAVESALKGAREDGTLAACLGSTYLASDENMEFAQLEVALSPGDAGLDLTWDRWSMAGNFWEWARTEERMTWNGTLVYRREWRASPRQKTLRLNQGVLSDGHAYVTALDFDFEKVIGGRLARPPEVQTKSKLALEGTELALACTSGLFARLVLPRLRPTPDSVTRVELAFPPKTHEYVLLGVGDDSQPTLNGLAARWASEGLMAAPEPGGRILRVQTTEANALSLSSVQLNAVSARTWHDRLGLLSNLGDSMSPLVHTPWHSDPTPWQVAYAPVHGEVVHLRGRKVEGNKVLLEWEESLDNAHVVVTHEVYRSDDELEWTKLGATSSKSFTAALPPSGSSHFLVTSKATVDRETLPPGLQVAITPGLESVTSEKIGPFSAE